jgi:uncharacterized protein with PQ loop repeat
MYDLIIMITGILFSYSLIPQIFKVIKNKSGKDLSWNFLIITFIGMITLTIVFFLMKYYFSFVIDLITSSCYGILIYLKSYYIIKETKKFNKETFNKVLDYVILNGNLKIYYSGDHNILNNSHFTEEDLHFVFRYLNHVKIEYKIETHYTLNDYWYNFVYDNHIFKFYNCHTYYSLSIDTYKKEIDYVEIFFDKNIKF